MKLRIRFGGVMRVLTIDDTRQTNCSLSDVKHAAFEVFQSDFNDDFRLSLNGKDMLENEDALVSDCGIVSGDLLYLLSKTAPQPQPGPSAKPKLLSSSPFTPSNNADQSISNKKTEQNTSNSDDLSNQDMDTDQPCTCSASCPEAGTSTACTNDSMDQEEVDHDICQYLSEPILCRDSSDDNVPALLKEAFLALKPETETEAFCVVLHVLMLETGFIVHPEPTVPGASCVPDRWKYPGYYKFTYTYKGYPENTVSLTLITTGHSVSVHGKVVCSNGPSKTCTLKPADYISKMSTDPAKCYRNLVRLNMVFKDTVAIPLLRALQQVLGLGDIFGLMGLTYELKLRILSFLNLRDLLKVALVNQELRDIAKDPYLWRRLYLQEFGNRRDNSLSQNWQLLFKQEYCARKERRKHMSRMMVTPPWGPSRGFCPHNPAPWLPPNPGGIIGGDYDLYPNFPSLPGAPGRAGQPPFMLPRPRYDLIGPPGVNPSPDPQLLPTRPAHGRGMGNRPHPFGGGFNPFF